MTDIRALTVRQPWAFAIAEGFKLVEIRTRRTSHRGPLLIHAGLTPDRNWGLTTYSPEATARFTELGGSGAAWQPPTHVPVTDWASNKPTALALGAFIAVAELVDVHEKNGCCKPWSESGHGLWHWDLRRVRLLIQPVPCRGKLGVWTPDPELAAQALDRAPVLQPVEYRVTFERIGSTGGRNGSAPPAPLTTTAIDGDQLAEHIGTYALRFLGSRDVEVHVDPTAGTGYILAGFSTAGRFTFQPTKER